ncbi:MAG: hypothetical protein IJ188_06135 [Clostridia bacterium]|nr:hypothetical protein [Clostridia bacterium]MBQ9252195.1 hypothetical protein [Clostridia bacterium]
MKRILAVLALVCLLVACTSVAFAAITITEQPETQTVKAGGSVTFTVKAKNAGGEPTTWYFINPATGETTTGRKLADVVKGVKVSGPNTLKIKLSKVPESMHGWQVYCHIGNKNGGVNTDTVMLLIAGMDPPTMAPAPATVAPKSADAAATPAPQSEEATTLVVKTQTPEPKQPIVIKGSKVDLYKMDSKGNVTSSTPQKELSFDEDKVNFLVRLPEGTEGTIQYLTIDGIRFTPEGEVTGMSIRGWDRSASVRVKLSGDEEEMPTAKPKATEEPVDEADLVTVSCTNCRFTGWHNTFAESGKVPVGTKITVVASGGLIKKGYSINGEKAINKNMASFSYVVEGDTTITMEEQK